ncbi:4'-phosphopantetheinyl transferase [Thiogranum longum]|uniref:4'-phosphopantetheinyl transferase n=1 Tax=Thiogranum longum TaxID=1537524 RepID=A0A4R1HF75_9GAMM|nr:4'-phosphopantetheinyl transferase superfamily protein [Thiogranum longum]TCK18860.1 4'-phosphopantetheinyl transferase [Thiogranum longum]
MNPPAKQNTDILSSEAHVWLVTPESISDSAILQYCHEILDPDERSKVDRFLHPRDSHSYLVSHAMVRSVLSRYAAIAPSDWRFSHGKHGRPEIACENQARLRFNLTHTNGLAACIVTNNDKCGIDAERLKDRTNPLGVAKRMFSSHEHEQLQKYEGTAFLKYFYERWTLREAYVKALGIGISFPTRQLRFNVVKEKIDITFDDAIDDSEDNWEFRLIQPDTEHIVALALHRCAGARKRICVKPFDFRP